jgi:hypothetical protein
VTSVGYFLIKCFTVCVCVGMCVCEFVIMNVRFIECDQMQE